MINHVLQARYRIASGVLDKMIFETKAIEAALPMNTGDNKSLEVYQLVEHAKELLNNAKEKLK